ncbi:MAG: hypothetical protein HKO99_11315 [Xanthomonadales bacterium]|nr:hypothetical protein [Gammaproteobacteria bacterium]NNK52174.1 hypothetical protein [Xanthomonadales bacterium]
MNTISPKLRTLCMVTTAFVTGTAACVATATEPCGDFGECKALIEINSSDGDIGFHFLMDGDDLNSAMIQDPNGVKVFQDRAKGPLKEQKLTETFAESAEPLCWEPEDMEEDEDIVTLEDFLDRWAEGTYFFTGSGDEGEKSEGETELTYMLPAAPVDLEFDTVEGVISWSPGFNLGNCADFDHLANLVAGGVLPVHPIDVTVDEWEVVMEPDVDDGDPLGSLVFNVRVAGDSALMVTVPAEYLAYFEDNTLGKIEVGAIGGEDNATFTEVEICINEVGEDGCEIEEED